MTIIGTISSWSTMNAEAFIDVSTRRGRRVADEGQVDNCYNHCEQVHASHSRNWKRLCRIRLSSRPGFWLRSSLVLFVPTAATQFNLSEKLFTKNIAFAIGYIITATFIPNNNGPSG